MKKYTKIIVGITIVLIALQITGCGDRSEQQLTDILSKEQQKQGEDKKNLEVKNEVIDSEKEGEGKELSEQDFEIQDNNTFIKLGELYEKLQINEEELYLENNFITDETVGDFYYKYFIHEYENVSLVTSNKDYNVKGDDIDTYYITTITLKTPKYKTIRGAQIGQNDDYIKELYGEGKYVETEDEKRIEYRFGDNLIMFILNDQNQISEIVLTIDKQEESNKEIKYSNNEQGFEIGIPSTWEGKYVIEQGTDNVKFYHIYNGEKGDVLFNIGVFGTEKDWENSSGDELPLTKLGVKDGVVYVSSSGGDINYDIDTQEGKEKAEDLENMMQDYTKICDSFKFLK